MNQEETKALITELANALLVADKQLAVLISQRTSWNLDQWKPVFKSNAELYARAAAYLRPMETTTKNCFGELLGILSDEELLRFRRRFEMRKNLLMAEILSDEIAQREGLANNGPAA